MAPILGFAELKVGRFWLSLLCEIIGTAILINIVGGSSLGGHTSNLQVSLTAGFTVATVVWCLVHVSGGCINPAVPVALFATRRMSLTRAVLYVISECIGGVLGAASLYITTPSNYEHPKNKNLNLLSWSQVVAIEMIITFFLLFTVFATIDKRRPGIVSNNASAPIIIGLSVAAAHNWAGPLTGGVMNPAAIFGPAVLSGIWDKHWAYWIGELSGAVLAGLLYEFLLAANASKVKLRAFLTSYDYDDSQFDENGRLSELTANKLNDKHELATVEHK